MAEIYIAFVDTPGLFAGIIRRVLKQKYIHVAVSLDPHLEEAYSIGRRHPSVPMIAGFEKEDKEKIFRAFPTADYMICSVECTEKQKEFVKEHLHEAMRNRFRYHYTILGLPFILLNKPFFQKGHYTCSSYSALILEQAGICSFSKHFSLVTPKDFYEYENKQIIFEGSLKELIESGKDYIPDINKNVPGFLPRQPAYAGAVCMRTVMKRGIRYER